VPYVSEPNPSLIAGLTKAAEDSQISILLLHCTLEIGFSMSAFGDEEKLSYFPITRETLSRLGYEYILAGHFHSQPYHSLY
jgi:exonuclease SbcD